MELYESMYDEKHSVKKHQYNPQSLYFKDLPGLFLARFLEASSFTILPPFVWDLSYPLGAGFALLAFCIDRARRRVRVPHAELRTPRPDRYGWARVERLPVPWAVTEVPKSFPAAARVGKWECECV